MSILTRGERFKDARTVYNQNKKQTMKAVETATGISASLIKDLEDDKSTRSVGYDKVAALAKHYGVSSDFLLNLSDDPAIRPSAVDELGLYPETIDELLSNYEIMTGGITDIYEDPSIRAINITLLEMLESPIFEMIRNLAASIKDEEAAPESALVEDRNLVSNGASLEREDTFSGFALRNELINAHPELAGRIHVTYGSMTLKPQLDEICNLFRDIVEEITGYKRFFAD